jgi:hypothetical protein
MLRRIAIFLALFAITLGVRLHFITFEYPDLDQAESMYHAAKILAGSVLYRDSFTHHHPGAIVASIAARIIFSESHLATNWLGLGLTLAAGGIVLLTLFETTLPFAALLGALVTTLGYFPSDIPFYPQSITAIFVALLLWIHYRGQNVVLEAWFMRGLICGFAFAADQRCALLLFPALWESVASGSKLISKAGLILLGFVVGLTPLILYLVLFNAQDDYLYQCWIFPATLRSGGFDLVKFLTTGLKLHSMLNSGLAVAAVAGLIVCVRNASRRLFEIGYYTSFVSALFLIAAAGNETFSNYLIIWFPVIGILCGFLFGAIQTRFVIGGYLSLAMAGLVILLSVEPTEVKSVFSRPYFRYAQTEQAREAAQYVRTHNVNNGDLYVWGYFPQFYLYAHQLSNFRHVNQIAITGAYFSDAQTPNFEPTKTQAFVEFERYMSKSPPEFFIIYDNIKSWKTFDQRITQAQSDPNSHLYLLSMYIFRQLEERYELVKTIGDFSIYKLKLKTVHGGRELNSTPVE